METSEVMDLLATACAPLRNGTLPTLHVEIHEASGWIVSLVACGKHVPIHLSNPNEYFLTDLIEDTRMALEKAMCNIVVLK